ncbi:MAG: hypothetical protein ACJ72H_07470 [Candidatus Sulfotelmatobacter sp.]
MKRLLLLLLLCAIVFTVHPTTSDAQTCPTGYFNMLDWMNLNTGATQHLTGTSNPQYTVIPANNIFWHIKGDHSGQGYPWDVSYYDANYIYGWITENVWESKTR